MASPDSEPDVTITIEITWTHRGPRVDTLVHAAQSLGTAAHAALSAAASITGERCAQIVTVATSAAPELIEQLRMAPILGSRPQLPISPDPRIGRA